MIKLDKLFGKQTCNYRSQLINVMIKLTHSLELLFEFHLVFAISDAKVVIGVTALVDAVRRSGRPDGEDCGRPLRPLCPTNLLDGHHVRRKM